MEYLLKNTRQYFISKVENVLFQGVKEKTQELKITVQVKCVC